MAPPGSATLPAFWQGESEVSRGSHPKSNPTDPTPPAGSGCFPIPSTRSSRCQGWAGMRRTWAAVAAPYFSRAESGEGKRSCRVSESGICTGWQSSHPRPRALPARPEGTNQAGARGTSRDLGVSRVGAGMGITPVEPGDVGQERRWQRQPPRVVTSEGRERKDGFEEAAAGLPEGSLPASPSA